MKINVELTFIVYAFLFLSSLVGSAFAVNYSPQRYNNGQMEQQKNDVWKVMGVPLDYQTSSTNCSEIGMQTFDLIAGKMQLCDGTKKYNINCGRSLTACDSLEKGLQKYNETLNVMQYCDGTVWVYMGSVPGVPCCPDGYIPVPEDGAAGTTADFCVSKYHMKPKDKTTHASINGKNLGQNSSYYPDSRAADQPWGAVSQAFAKIACSELGPEFHLITNAEWMTIAKSIELNDDNWSGGSVGSGHIPTGHSDGHLNSGQDFLAASVDDNDGCYGTGNINCLNKLNSDYWQKRTFELSNGEIIWDMAGNINSVIDVGGVISQGLSTPNDVYQLNDTVGNNPLFPGPTLVYPALTPFLFPPDPIAINNKFAFLPFGTYSPPNDYYDQLGFGTIRLGYVANIGLFRGGKFNEPMLWRADPDPDPWMRHFKTGAYERRAGIYSVWVYPADSNFDNLGFRCTYIPQN